MYFKFERYKIYYRKLIVNSQWLKCTKIEGMSVQNRQRMQDKYLRTKKAPTLVLLEQEA